MDQAIKGFVGGAYSGAAPQFSADECVNLYPETDESQRAKNSGMLVGRPGLAPWSSIGGPTRGLWVGEERLFAAGGDTVYEITSGGGVSALGSIGGGTDPVTMMPNGGQLGIVAGGKFYVATGAAVINPSFPAVTGTVDTNGSAVTIDTGGPFDSELVGQTITINGVDYTVASVNPTLNTITLSGDAGVQTGVSFSYQLSVTASAGAFLDGYFIIARPNSKQINISALYDGLTWDPLDFAIKEGYPDNIAQLLADHEELWIFGTQTSEVWRNTGNNNFPFERDPGGFMQIGCIAPYTPQRIQITQQVSWLGGDPNGWAVAYLGTFGNPRRISNHAVEKQWSSYATVADAESYSYIDDGHCFIVFNFPSGNASWAYDVMTNEWFRLAYNGATSRHRVRNHGFVFGKHIVGDYQTGELYVQSLDLFDDAGTPILCRRTCPHMANAGAWTFYHRIRLDLENNDALTTTLSWSDDGGHNFSKARSGSPAQGAAELANGSPQTVLQQAWRRCGRGRDRVLRFEVSGAARKALINAYADFMPGA